MPSLSTKERKAKVCVAIKEFNELLNLITIKGKLEKKYPINQQQVAEIDELDELYDEIWKFDEPIKNLEILLAKTVSSAALLKKKDNQGDKRKDKRIKSRIRKQARFDYARRI